MNDPKLAEAGKHPTPENLNHVLSRLGDLLKQARDAKAKGVLGDFFKQLLATLGPMLGPIILALLQSLLHIPPFPTP